MASGAGAVLGFIALVAMLMCHTSEALDFAFFNHAQGTTGGDKFDQLVGSSGAKEIMDSSTKFIWNTFQQSSAADRKNVDKVTLVVESNMDVPAKTSADEIHLSADYVGSYGGDVKTEIRGVLYHEMTHVWQNGLGIAPVGLTEGMADYVRLTADLAPSHWVKPGSGDKWDHGYDVTALFLQYCESISSGFVASMNAKMASGWNLDFFNKITGKSVDQLWSDYKAKYGSA